MWQLAVVVRQPFGAKWPLFDFVPWLTVTDGRAKLRPPSVTRVPSQLEATSLGTLSLPFPIIVPASVHSFTATRQSAAI